VKGKKGVWRDWWWLWFGVLGLWVCVGRSGEGEEGGMEGLVVVVVLVLGGPGERSTGQVSIG